MKRSLSALTDYNKLPVGAAGLKPRPRPTYTTDSTDSDHSESIEISDTHLIDRKALKQEESVVKQVDNNVKGARGKVKNYAARLSHYPNKGACGLKEIFDSEKILCRKITTLCELVKEAKHLVVITGAGISTSVGIPDFRGPNGVWTLEKLGKKQKTLKIESDKGKDSAGDIKAFSGMEPDCFDKAKPSITHEIITELHRRGIVKYLISQNVDGLHLRSGFPRSAIAELHGNLYTEKCGTCKKEYFGDHDLGGVGLRPTGAICKDSNCGGILYDTVLDWDNQLPEPEFQISQDHCKKSDLILCLGTSLRIVPVADMPLMGEKFVVVNLQRTPIDADAELVIHANVDYVMQALLQFLNMTK